jgi:hypothetical protein
LLAAVIVSDRGKRVPMRIRWVTVELDSAGMRVIES